MKAGTQFMKSIRWRTNTLVFYREPIFASNCLISPPPLFQLTSPFVFYGMTNSMEKRKENLTDLWGVARKMTVSFSQVRARTKRNSNRPKWGSAPLLPGCLANGSHMALGLHCGMHRSRQKGKAGIVLAAWRSKVGLKGISTLFFLALLRIEPRALCMLGKHIITELYP